MSLKSIFISLIVLSGISFTAPTQAHADSDVICIQIYPCDEDGNILPELLTEEMIKSPCFGFYSSQCKGWVSSDPSTELKKETRKEKRKETQNKKKAKKKKANKQVKRSR